MKITKNGNSNTTSVVACPLRERKEGTSLIDYGSNRVLYLGNGLGHTQLLLLRGHVNLTRFLTYGLYFCSKLILKILRGKLNACLSTTPRPKVLSLLRLA